MNLIGNLFGLIKSNIQVGSGTILISLENPIKNLKFVKNINIKLTTV